MLVLTRKVKEMIQIGDAITITVVRVKGRSVRLGIEAPAEVRVRRGELSLDPQHPRETHSTETDATTACNEDYPRSMPRPQDYSPDDADTSSHPWTHVRRLRRRLPRIDSTTRTEQLPRAGAPSRREGIRAIA